MSVCETKTPASCSEAELREFEELAISAGKVTSAGLAELVRRARLLAFLRDSGRLIGVAGLKCPRNSYRQRVSERSGVQLLADIYPYELGWVSVLPTEEGGQSKRLCEPLISQVPGEGMFSTTGMRNEKMRARLGKMGFVEVGKTWKSSEGNETLCLFTLARGGTAWLDN